jgi:hypothetical protein
MQVQHQIKSYRFLNELSSLATGNTAGRLDIVPTERQQVFVYRHARNVTHDASDSGLRSYVSSMWPFMQENQLVEKTEVFRQPKNQSKCPLGTLFATRVRHEERGSRYERDKDNVDKRESHHVRYCHHRFFVS